MRRQAPSARPRRAPRPPRRAARRAPARAGAASRDRLAERLHAAAIHLLRHVRRADRALDVGPAGLSALSVLVFAGPRTLSALAQAEQVTAATMSRMVKGLEARRLVVRRPDASDARVTWLHPTARGRRLLHLGRRRRIQSLEALLAPLDSGDRSLLLGAVAILERIARARG
jgi:DNA-binding MarR family transcriptional regulator